MKSSRVILTPDKNTWLVDHTEKFCKDKAIYNAILESIEIIDGKSKDKTANALPSILSDALSVSFDTNIGHDYLYDAESRFESYHKVEDRLSFDLEGFNKVTNGGIPRKTLNVIMAAPMLVSPCSCVTTLHTATRKARMSCTSLVKWQKSESQNASMRT